MGPDPELRAELDLPLPEAVWSGPATPIFVCGTIAGSSRVGAAELLVDGAPHPLDAQVSLGSDGIRFWGTVPVASTAAAGGLEIAVRSGEAGGAATAPLG